MESIFLTVREALSDRYDVRRIVGTGGMATVFQAWDRSVDQTVAIKVLKPELASGVPLERFHREVAVASQLDHPHIISIFTHGEAHELPYFVMPFIDGETLRERLRRDRIVPLSEAIQIGRHVVAALECAHEQGIMHRDIKPENIMLSAEGAMVADFGIARAIEEDGSALTLSGTAIGTPHYMSPEQALGTEVDGRTDIYSLGCVLYEMIAGKRPFSDLPSPFARRPDARPSPVSVDSTQDVPPLIDDIVSRCLEWSPGKRFPGAADLAQELGEAQQLTGLPVPEVHGVGQARGWTLLGVVAAVILGAAFMVSRWAGPFPRQPAVLVNPFTYDGPTEYSVQTDSIVHGIAAELRQRVGVRAFTPLDSHLGNTYSLDGEIVVHNDQGGMAIAVINTIMRHAVSADTIFQMRRDTVRLDAQSITAFSQTTADRVLESVRNRSP